MALVAPLPLEEIDVARIDLSHFRKGPLGLVPNSVRTMAHRPQLAAAFIGLAGAVMPCAGNVTLEQKRLIGLVASLTAGCRYCQAHNSLAATRLGTELEADGKALGADLLAGLGWDVGKHA